MNNQITPNYQSIGEELLSLHEEILKEWPSLLRIAVALYDDESDLLHTFVRSSLQDASLDHYSFELSQSESLTQIRDTRQPRLIQDTRVLTNHNFHSEFIAKHYRSSYTEPMFMGQNLLGFIFFDASDVDYFSDELILQLSNYTRLIESLINVEILPVKMMVGMVQATREFTRARDAETASHIIRMAHYMELIAIQLADEVGFTDEQIEHIWLYAPMHDIGKIAIPDHILTKPGALDKDEFEQIKRHVEEGLKMLNVILDNFKFQNFYHIDMLKDIIGAHHERWDGSGYPKGMVGEQIPIVGRIAAVADVFDALSSNRVYRSGMKPEEVFDYLEQNKGILFDPRCVEVFIESKSQVMDIYSRFQET